MCKWEVNIGMQNVVTKQKCPHGPTRQIMCYFYDDEGKQHRDPEWAKVVEFLMNGGMRGDVDAATAAMSLSAIEVLKKMRADGSHANLLEMADPLTGKPEGCVIYIANTSVSEHIANALRDIMNACLSFKKEG